MTTSPPPPQPAYGSTWQDPEGHQPQSWGPGHPPAPPVPQPDPPKKSWFRRHKILTALLVVIALIVLANLVGGDDEEGAAGTVPAAQDAAAEPVAEAEPAADAEPSAEEADAAESEPAEEPTTEETPAEEPTTEDAPAEEAPEPSTPGVGEAVRDGNFEFTVHEVQAGLTTIGEGFAQETPQGQFVLVDVTVSNIGDSATTLLDSNQTLIDDQGRQHETSSSSIWLDEAISFDDINPGNSVRGMLLYDIPTDAVPVSIELHDSMFSGGVTVALQ